MKKIYLIICLFPFVFMGCGGEDDLSASGNVSAGEMQSTASGINSMLQELASDTDGSINPGDLLGSTPVPVGFGVSAFATVYDSCTNLKINKSTDGDSDGIPVHIRQEFDCKGITVDSLLTDFEGYTEVRDLDDDREGEYEIIYDLSRDRGVDDIFKWNGQFSYKTKGRDIIHSADLNIYTKYADHDPELDFSFRSKFDFVRTPTDPSSPFASGKIKLLGAYAFKGRLGGDSDGNDLGVSNIVFEIRSLGLTYDSAACTGYFKEGSIVFEDGAGNTYETTYHCNSAPTVTFNGQPFDS